LQEFLSDKGFVHRDLAARNVLVGNNKIVKIGDFGLTRFVYNDRVYFNRKGGKFPLKWMSIEAIQELRFSTASDV
jgi:serine/threonine protein kinase